MTHPRLPVEHPSCPVSNDSECLPLQPGIWYYKIVEGDHILFILNRERAGVQFDVIYDSIFERCRKHILKKTTQTIADQGTTNKAFERCKQHLFCLGRVTNSVVNQAPSFRSLLGTKPFVAH